MLQSGTNPVVAIAISCEKRQYWLTLTTLEYYFFLFTVVTQVYLARLGGRLSLAGLDRPWPGWGLPFFNQKTIFFFVIKKPMETNKIYIRCANRVGRLRIGTVSLGEINKVSTCH